jgi:hypothetical protein
MASVMLFSRAEARQEVQVEAAPENTTQRLRRSGKRDYAFTGLEICSSTSHGPGPSLWYEINLYRKPTGPYVVDVRFFSKSESMRDRFHAFDADSLDDVASVLESYEPAFDIEPDVNPEDSDMPHALFVLKAAMLRIRIDEARRQFRDLVGDVLHQLDV